ncbi:uncharacterized protein BKCO1_3700010 [Diplodia corticola]|uniref:SigF-like NTF2-like domain-containing protein n=1 Tax=Diplodia corticola TaxID=236234 RepID=A0A1J9RZ17_9PEZI|nr:uncharacterized protein BKCO1_3700010 [Diplodia corticola]OJD32693.1 hypothetical protein BKCO1_3700010 [Diplodia corticola]
MENPENEVAQVIYLLTQSPPRAQRAAIEKYFTRNASFTHPFCRTGKFGNSRALIVAIYRWYKIMSPRIDLRVNSVAFDQTNLILYVHISQVFRVWLIPFYSAPASLVTVLHLARVPASRSADEKGEAGRAKYYITAQNDLYQTSEFVRFFWPGGFLFVWMWQLAATFFCVLGALFLSPLTALQEHFHQGGGLRGKDVPESLSGRLEKKYL